MHRRATTPKARAGTRLMEAAVAAALLVVGLVPATLSSATSVDPATGAGESVYVARASSGPVTAYPTSSTGKVPPARTLADPGLAGTVWDPWGVALGPDGSVYVQSFLSDATTLVFAPGSSGTTAPTRVFRVGGPDSRSIAVDAAGYAAVATGEAAAVIDIAAPGASGRAADLYDVTPVRAVPTSEAVWHPWPDILSLAGPGDVAAALVGAGGNAVDVFASGSGGGAAPVRSISGASTGLGSCGTGTCTQVSVAYSPVAQQLDVAVDDGAATRIEVFPVGAAGDVAPTCTISGARTRLARKVLTGIAVSPTTGTIYVMAKTKEFGGTGRVDAFSATRCGNVAPVRSFGDRSNGFSDAMGIAVGP